MGSHIRALRLVRRWRQRDLADQVKVVSRRVLGQTMGASERTISRWENGETPSMPAQRVLAAVFDVPLAELGFLAPATRAPTEEVPALPAHDAFELVARLTRSDASASTLEMLARRIDRLCRDYPVRPAADLIGESRQWLSRTMRLLDGRVNLAQHRELMVSAGWLSALTACLSFDLGDASGAESWREATSQLADEAGHAELRGWAHEIAAWMALVHGHPAEAIEFARAGQSIGDTSCVTVQLAAQEARGRARMGDRAGAEQAMRRGRRLLDSLPAPVNPEHHFVIDPAKADFYQLDCYRWLGVGDVAEQYADRVLDYCRLPDGSVRSPMRRSEALLTLGVVAARRGELDAAADYGVLALGEGRACLPVLRTVAAELDRELAPWAREPVVTGWRDRLHDLNGPQ